jgi:hypothetical protein
VRDEWLPLQDLMLRQQLGIRSRPTCLSSVVEPSPAGASCQRSVKKWAV